ncbi:MAG: tRNA guanosine(34) transglycosylase Tgt [Flavobacteriales bacterium]
MKFNIKNNDKKSAARTGIIETDHGNIETPAFMPVGTAGTVKTVHQRELKEDLKAEIILGNTYHLYLRPGLDILSNGKGLHGFMGWDSPILTDSGGYQVYSLSEGRNISEEGVEFKSHIDGAKCFISPEKAVDIQRTIGGDIIMAFDECTPYPCVKEYANSSMDLTHRWLKRSCEQFDRTSGLYGHSQSLFPIVQGSVYRDLRKKSAEYVSEMNREGNAIGGLSVGEPHELMYEMTELVCSILPENKPRYLMGVGTPINMLESIALGVDMFDCVMPTRNGRNGMLFTDEGTINIKNKKWKFNYSKIDETSDLFVDNEYSKAYLRHLIMVKESLGAQIASLHNLGFYLRLIRQARNKIREGVFARWKEEKKLKLNQKI